MLFVVMDEISFDTLAVEQSLRDAGFDESQAACLVRALAQSQQGLVTIDHLHRRLAVREHRLDGLDLKVSGLAQDIEALSKDMARRPSATEGSAPWDPSLDTRLERQFNRVQAQLVFRLGAIVVIGIAILAVLIKTG